MTVARQNGLPSLSHIMQLTDDCGVIQHATYDVPNRETGYCVDDVARAFIVALRMMAADGMQWPLRTLALRSLSFLLHAQREDGRFHNFMGYDRRWLDDVGSEDAFGRAVWALGWGLAASPERGWRRLCADMLRRALPHIEGVKHLRPLAYAALGLVQTASLRLPDAESELQRLLTFVMDRLLAARSRYDSQWRWFETTMTYDNARLPEALIRVGATLKNQRAIEVGLDTLAFLESVTMEGGVFVPVGNEGWYTRDGHRAVYAQQPIEAAAMVEAELAAYEVTGLEQYQQRAGVAYDWFFGHNTNGAVMVQGGGCRDGLEKDYVNRNMGAESTLSYLMAAIAMATQTVAEQRGVRS